MKRFESYEKVVAALKESKFLRVEGEEGAETVNRKVSYNPKSSGTTTSREPRFLYVKGFGDEEAGTQFDIEAYFNAHGPTNGVRLRRASDDRTFKGSVFVEFQDDETANLFLALNPAPLFKGKHKLEAMSKASYCEKKEKDIRDGVIVPSQSWGPPGRGRGRGRGRGHNNRGDRHREHRDRGDRDPDDWKKRREDDRSSGFKDSRGRNRGGRGGRGKRDDRGPRKNDRNRERDGYDDSIIVSFLCTNTFSVIKTLRPRALQPMTLRRMKRLLPTTSRRMLRPLPRRPRRRKRPLPKTTESAAVTKTRSVRVVQPRRWIASLKSPLKHPHDTPL